MKDYFEVKVDENGELLWPEEGPCVLLEDVAGYEKGWYFVDVVPEGPFGTIEESIRVGFRLEFGSI